MAEQRSDQNTRAQMTNNKQTSRKSSRNKNISEVTKATSLSTLILWNISKALEQNPAMNLKDAITAAQARLEHEREVSAMIPDSAEQRHLACAVLAWQQLGHSDADSLCQFIAKTKAQECIPSKNITSIEASVKSSHESKYSKDVHSMSFGSNSVGPVVKLPVETKIVMRMDNSPSARVAAKKPKAQERDTMNKIEAACCIDSACAERLAKMDTATTELRMRAGMLARREAERVELLERAEAAWRDLELGYQRRLTLAEEKEDDLAKQIQKAIEERNGYKNACTSLATHLRDKGDKAETDRAALSQVDKEVCERACLRLKLSEEAAQGDAVLAEHQCRAAQLERDLLFKEEQARRKLLNFQSELESSQTITHETERAMRAELSALREQIAHVSQQLLGEDGGNALLKKELEDLRQEKMGMVEDLEGCKATCDTRMQGKVDELKRKRDQLAELKDKVMECRCKLPVDVTVEAKRTASLAALCRCTPEEKILESCSCTSLRGKLLSNLLGDLFSGLQAEMGGTGTQMPCQLLKCLEDRHNWDRASIVKTNLKNYFSQLLIGELDIAIATAIEKYHAKWVGQSCADAARMIPDPGEDENEGWQERAIERRAQKLATKLAEQLFQERADQLTQRAKDIVSSGPPPCECKPPTGCGKEGAAAVYPVLISGRPLLSAPVNGPTTPANTPAYWRQTMQDVTQLRVQIEDLKKDSIKKEDLKLMEEKITKIVQRGSGTGKAEIKLDYLINSNAANDSTAKKEQKNNRAVNSNQSNNYVNSSKPTTPKRKQMESNSSHKRGLKPNVIPNNGYDKSYKSFKKLGQTYAINMCMCSQKDPNKIVQQSKILNDSIIEEGKGGAHRKDKVSKDSTPQLSNSIKQTKPINSSLQSQDISTRSISKLSGQQSCQSNCKCFHKVPSNTSIDKLLETLAKWKSDLNPCKTEKECEDEMPCCNFLPGDEISELNKNKQMHNDSNTPLCCKKNAVNENTCTTPLDTIQKGNKIPDIEEVSADISKISSRSSVFVEKTEQLKSNQSSWYDKGSSINDKSFSKTPSELKEKNIPILNSTKKTTATASARSNSYSSNKGNKKTDSSKGVYCDGNIIQNNLDPGVAPTTTESEYMGAINLDKSNEDFCKCMDRNETSDPPNEPFKCMPCKCSCKSLNTKKDDVQDNNRTELLFGGPKSQKGSQKMTKITQKNVSPTMINSQSKNNQNKLTKKETFPCDCGYDIQFLGVTLTDVPSNETKAPYDENEAQMKENNEMECGGCNSAKNKIPTSGREENNKRRASIKESYNKNEEKKMNAEKKQSVRDVNLKHRSNIIETNNSINIKVELKASNKENTCCAKGFAVLKQPITVTETNIVKNIKDENKDINKGKICEKCQLIKKPKMNIDVESCKTMPSCECKVNFDEFKNYIDVVFQNQQTNEDKGLDVQSFKDNIQEKQSCICCNKQNVDESEDLEENTFHLLEEHLKKKLEEFKETSCNLCIPPEEEEKLFTTILKRVKQVITDSTNKIACKCGNEEENSKGSWNRAYGLLQEYLKTKIKRVQCSCMTEDNTNDTILPEVLGKVCNLIEHDFQRLKDVCGCKKSELQDKDKQVYFKEEVPERDNDILNAKKTGIDDKIYSCCSQNPQTSIIIKDNNSSQVPAYLGMETKSCNPLETYAKKVQTFENAQDSLKSSDTTPDCNCCEKKVDAELLGTIEPKKSTESNNDESKTKPTQFANLPYIAYVSECVCRDTECTNNSVPVVHINNTLLENDVLKKPASNLNYSVKVKSITNNKPIRNNREETKTVNVQQNQENDISTRKQKCSIIEKNTDGELLGFNETKISQLSEPVKKDCICNPTNPSSCCENNENAKTSTSKSENLPYFSKPYIGYTIDCSCDTALGACVCMKSIFQTDNLLMDSIMKNSMPNDKYYETVSYIMKSKPTDNAYYNNDLFSDMNGDLYLHNILKHKTLYDEDLKHNCETEVSFDNEDITLKSSREYFEMAHTTTNTFDDNMSTATDYSNSEAPLDWCECCSQIPPREMNSGQLKQSIFFPVPLGKNNQNDIKKDNSQSLPKNLPTYCDCDLVPICHVKMLVENIENKLVGAKCICDSMIPKVCPIHSTRL